jgi:cytochrome c2
MLATLLVIIAGVTILVTILVMLGMTGKNRGNRKERVSGGVRRTLDYLFFVLIFGLTGITAGYYAYSRSNLKHTDLFAMNNDMLHAEPGQILIHKKCGKCHSLERVYLTYKNDIAWNKTVKRMAEFDYPNITSSDARHIVAYLIQQERRRRRNADRLKIGKNIVSRKCGVCHDLDRVFRANKSKQEWTDTLNSMVKIPRASVFLSEQEEEDIVAFLSSRRTTEK